MKNVSVLIKPASSLCNMRCKYCFYADVSKCRDIASYGLMKLDTAYKMIDHIYQDLEDGDGISFAFQGGEPTLAGLDFFVSFLNYVKKKNRNVRVSYSLQTNGLMLDDKWCNFLYQNHFLVGLSLDGDAEFHNANRIKEDGKGTFTRVMKAKNMLDQNHVEYNILCVLTNQTARHPQRMWNFIKSEKIRYIQFIPCLSELTADSPSQYALQPERFEFFYTELLKRWKDLLFSGNYISIKFFDDIIHLLGQEKAYACGLNGQCHPQYVIEADGSIYPCDFYVLDEYCAGNITEITLHDAFNSGEMQHFLFNRKGLPDFCQSCNYKGICNGGCKRMKHSMYLNREENYCGLQGFLDKNKAMLYQIIDSL